MTSEAGQSPVQMTMSHRYRIDPGHSSITLQAFAGGLLSFAAHNPTFAARDFEGELRWHPNADRDARLDITVRANSLDLVGNVRPADREDIMSRMQRDVLEVDLHPEIRFHSEDISSTPVGQDQFRVAIAGLMSLHGVTNRETIDQELVQYSDGVRLIGSFPLRLSAYQIRPVTALGGAIHLKDLLRVTFDLAAWREEG